MADYASDALEPTGKKTSFSELVFMVHSAIEEDEDFKTVPKAVVDRVVKELVFQITDELYRGNEVAMSIGTFVRADKEARTSRNPRTGDPVEAPARAGARFKVGARLKKYLNDEEGGD